MQQFEVPRSQSSSVSWARYKDGILEIDFRDSKTGAKQSTYRYDGTLLKDGTNPTGCYPQPEWNAFQSAERKGEYFAYHIRPVYKGVKL